jgi:sugar/nucleoside kinase (ribokinase family)
VDIATKSELHLAVNVQTNAGNRGFNTLSKYPKIDFFTVNSRELQLELRSKNVNFSSVVPKLMGDLGASKAVLTLGAEGILIFDGGFQIKVPAFATKIVDKVGAGDSVFAISSLLSFTNCPPEITGLVANIVAAHEIAKVGHQTPLTLGDIKKQIRSLLG